jgi:hypothetical protein
VLADWRSLIHNKTYWREEDAGGGAVLRIRGVYTGDPGSGFFNNGSRIRDPGSKIHRNPDSDPQQVFFNPNNMLLDLENMMRKAPDPGSRIPDPVPQHCL